MIDPITFLPTEFKPNELQEIILKYLDTDGNMVVSAPTGSGKSNTFNIRAHKFLFTKNPFNRKKVVYIAPMKSIVEQKKAEFFDNPESPYAKFNCAMMTGDYYNEKDDTEGMKADVIIATPESFASKLRNLSSSKNDWLKEVGMVFVDEAHYIGDEGRGAGIEDLILNITLHNKKCEIVLVSGTIPNAEELAEWVDTLNEHPTIYIVSDYRPVPVEWHFVKYKAPNNKHDQERAKIDKVIEILNNEKDRQFMVGVFNKEFGRTLTAELQSKVSKNVDFHNADRTKLERATIEKRFLSRNLDGVVATQTLAVGVNTPASVVVVPSVTRGKQDVEVTILQQLAGRAGRRGFDTRGDVYFLIKDDDDFDYHVNRIMKGEPAKSLFGSIQKVALNFLGAINNGTINKMDDLVTWYERTLYNYQHPKTHEEIEKHVHEIVEAMTKYKMIKESRPVLELTRRGIIAVQMAYDPYAVYGLISNFTTLFQMSSVKKSDIAIAWGKNLNYYEPISKSMEHRFPAVFVSNARLSKAYLKPVSCVFWQMTKDQRIPADMTSTHYSIMRDLERTASMLVRLAKESEGYYWGKNAEETIKTQFHMIKSQLSEEEALLIAQGLTKHEASQAVGRGIRNLRMKNGLASRKLGGKKK